MRQMHLKFIGTNILALGLMLVMVSPAYAAHCTGAARGISFRCPAAPGEIVCGSSPSFTCYPGAPVDEAALTAEGREFSCTSCAPTCVSGRFNCNASPDCEQVGSLRNNACTAADGRPGTFSNDCGTTCSVTPRPAVTLAPYGADADNTGSPSIWVNKVPRPGETIVANPLAQLQENGLDRLRVDPSGNLRIIGRSATEGGDLYLNSGKSIRVDGVGATTLNIGNYVSGGSDLHLRLHTSDTGLADIIFQQSDTDVWALALRGDESGTDSGNFQILRNPGGGWSSVLTINQTTGSVNLSNDLNVRGNVEIGTATTERDLVVHGDVGATGIHAGTEDSRFGGALDVAGILAAGDDVIVAGQLRVAARATAPGTGSGAGALYYSTDAAAPAVPGLRVWDGDSWEAVGGSQNLTGVLNAGADASTFTNLTTIGGPIMLGTTGGNINAATGKCPTNYLGHDVDADGVIENGECFGNIMGGGSLGVYGSIGSANGSLALSAPTSAATAGHIILNSGKSIFVQAASARSSLNISNSATGSLGTQLNVGGHLQVSERGAFGGFGVDPNWWVSTPSIYVGSGSTGTIIGAGGRNGAGDITTDRRLTVGGSYTDPSAPAGSAPTTKATCPAGTVAVDFDGDGGQGTGGSPDLGECYSAPGTPSFGVVGGQFHTIGQGRFTQSLIVGANPPSAYVAGSRGEVGIETRLTVGGSYNSPLPGAVSCLPSQDHLDFNRNDVVDGGECYLPPEGATGYAVIGGDLSVLRSARVKEGLYTTGQNAFTGGEGIPFILGLGPEDSDRDTAAAQLTDYLLIRNMNVNSGSGNPLEQVAIRVVDETGTNEWFSVRRTGYALPVAPVRVSTSGEMNALTMRAASIIATGTLSGVGLAISGTGTLDILRVGATAQVGTAITDLGLGAGGNSLILGVANGDTMNAADYLLRLQTIGPIPGGRGPIDRLTLNKDGALSVGGINTIGGVTVGSSLAVGSGATIGSTLDVGGSITSGSSNVQITTSAGGLKLAELANEDFDTHTTTGGTASSTNEGYFIVGLKSSQGTCDNACDKHGLLCDAAYQVGSTSMASGGTNGCGNTTSNKYCWCKG